MIYLPVVLVVCAEHHQLLHLQGHAHGPPSAVRDESPGVHLALQVSGLNSSVPICNTSFVCTTVFFFLNYTITQLFCQLH
jgi:hypothetical protein